MFASVEPRDLFTRLKGWRRKPPSEGKGKEMYLSKIQVKNAVVRIFDKFAVSRTMKGRVCDYSSSGYKFEEKENGFIGISYFYSTSSYDNKDFVVSRRTIKMEAVKSALVAAGFEFDGQDGFRKERKA